VVVRTGVWLAAYYDAGPRGRQWLDRGCGLLLLGMAGWMLWQAWPR
jgi:threonine/homoserine/homoserine lactone efflux protein